MITKTLFYFFLGVGLAGADYSITLEEVSSVFLPTDASQRFWDVDVCDSASYDAENKLLYVVGGLFRTVIDMNNPANLAPLRTDMSSQGNLEYTDVSVCGNYFIQTTVDTANIQQGKVEVYRTFDATTPTQVAFSVDVDGDPTAVRFLPGCKAAVVVTRGTAYGSGSNFVDPMGKIYIIRIPGPCTTGPCDIIAAQLNFTAFDSRFGELSNSGVRFVYRGRGNNFSNDVDPLTLTLSNDGKTAYVTLQRTNAIAVVDLVTYTIIGVYGLGMKSWQNLKMDASDRDGGIMMRNWPIYSYYLPDGIDYLSHGGKDYVVTANEGDDYDYSDLIGWKEETRGREFVEKNLTAADLNEDMKSWLANDTMLGRLRFTSQNGENNTGGYGKFVTLGSRSFSIWDAKTLQQVYDSGDDIASQYAAKVPEIFNGGVNQTDTPGQDMDMESQKRGPEPESIAVGSVGRVSLVFVGNESPGTVFVYSILDDVTKPRFESIWHGVKNTSLSWENQFNSKTLAGIDPERILFLPETDSPTGKPAIIVVASGSGSVTLLNVVLSGTVPAPSSAGDVRLSSMLVLLLFMFHAVLY